jgi:nitrite reductase/ring-hydroxylating ferredoxin subunit
MTWVDAADASLSDGSVTAVEAGGTLVALARAAGTWHAVEAWCTHAECPLSDGWLEGAAIRCPCHGSLFDLATGDVLEGPAAEPLRVFPARVTGERVELELP